MFNAMKVLVCDASLNSVLIREISAWLYYRLMDVAAPRLLGGKGAFGSASRDATAKNARDDEEDLDDVGRVIRRRRLLHVPFL